MDIFRSSAQYFTHLIHESAHSFAYLIHEYGLVAVAAIVGLECLGLPVLPGETALLGAAIYAGAKHDLNITAVILTAAGAAMVGRMIGYVIGHEFGYWLLLRSGHYVALTTGRIKLGQYLFLRYGGKIIFIAQFVPVLRSLAGLFAGANLMPWRNFMLANAVSSVVWAASYGYAAFWAGGEFLRLQGRLGFLLALIVLIVLIAGGFFVRRREAQLITEAERAIPGPLELRQPPR
jgi:membrane protein DedA with SNARE-associated domain